MWNLKCDLNELIYKMETDSQTKKNLRLPKGKVGDKLGVWKQQIQTTIYKIYKYQGPTVEHRKLYLISYNKP